MPDDPVIENRHKGEIGIVISVVPQRIHEPCFVFVAECLAIDLIDRRDILRKFRPDKKGIHPVLLALGREKGRHGAFLYWIITGIYQGPLARAG
jgi:hypothetical protein